MIETQTLEYFLAVARKGTISAAAEALFITQPYLSRRLAEFERQTGKTLFVRGKRQITLTEEGELLKRRAEEITALLLQTERELLAKEALLEGCLAIGLPELSGTRLIMQALHTMRQRQPNVKFHLITGGTETVVRGIETEELEAGVVQEEAALHACDYLRLPCRDRWGVLMRRDSPLAALARVGPEDLRPVPLMILSQPDFKNRLAGWVGVNDRRLNIIADYNLSIHARYMVEADGCYALVPEGSVNTVGNSCLCWRPLYPDLEISMTLIWKKYRPFSKNMDYFFRILRKEAVLSETSAGADAK